MARTQNIIYKYIVNTLFHYFGKLAAVGVLTFIEFVSMFVELTIEFFNLLF